MIWTDADAVALRDYLASPSGQNLKQEFIDGRPKAEGKTLEEVALGAKIIEGWDLLAAYIKEKAEFKSPQSAKPEFVEVDQ